MGNETTAQSTTSVKITDISKTAINSGWARDITLQNLVDNSADANSILKAMAAAQGVEVKLQTEVQKDSKASLDAINQNLASGNKDRTRYDREYLSSVSDLEKSLSAVTQNLKYGLSNLASSLHSASPETFLQSLGSVTGGIFGAGLLKSLTGSGVLGAFEKLGEAAVGGAVAVSVMAINMSKQFQTLSDTGNNFNGSMDKLKDASMNLGMNYDDMSQILTKYSSLGAAMGDKQITEGTRFNKSLKDSIDYMTSYGMSANDYTDAVDSFASALNTAGDRVGKSFQDLEPVVGNYLDNLSAVSALTGQSKKQLEEQHQSLMDSERTKAEFMTLTDKQQSNLNAATANLPPALAQMMMDAMVAQIKGMPALESAATRQYMASSPEAQNAVNAGINGQSNAAQLAMTSAADYFNKNSNLLSTQFLLAPDNPVGQLGDAFIQSVDSAGWQNFTKELADGADAATIWAAAVKANQPDPTTAANEDATALMQASMNQFQDTIHKSAFDEASTILPTLSNSLQNLANAFVKYSPAAITGASDATNLITKHPTASIATAAGIAALSAIVPIIAGKGIIGKALQGLGDSGGDKAPNIGPLLKGGKAPDIGPLLKGGSKGIIPKVRIFSKLAKFGLLGEFMTIAALPGAVNDLTSPDFKMGLDYIENGFSTKGLSKSSTGIFGGTGTQLSDNPFTKSFKLGAEKIGSWLGIGTDPDAPPTTPSAPNTPKVATINPNTYMAAALDYFKKSHMYYSDSMALWNDIHAQLVKLTGVTGDEMTKLQYNVKRLGNSVY